MPKLLWDETGKHFYETGTRMGVLYPQDDTGAYPKGVAWNGLTGVTLSPSGAEETALYSNDDKYISLYSKETVGGTIQAYYSPEEFDECDGTAELIKGVKIGQQTRKPFGFCWRTVLGNDLKKNDYGYTIHIVYGCTASPSEKAYTSINESPEAVQSSWTFTTTPVTAGNKKTSTVEFKSTSMTPAQLKAIEDVLYGTEEKEAHLPLPDEIKTIIESAAQ